MSHQQPEDPSDPFRLGDDPGWRPGNRDGRPDGLVGLRFVFLAIVWSLVLIGIVVAFLASGFDRTDDTPSPWLAAGVVAAVGVIGLLVLRLAPLRLDCSDELALAASWRTRFFARTAASEVSSLAGFVGVLFTGAPALYALGLGFTVLGLAVSGPTRANLVRDQEQLALDGCAIALVPALRHAVTR